MLFNYTPHDIVLYDKDGQKPMIVYSSVGNARCTVERELVGYDGGVPLYRAIYGAVEGLPEPEEGRSYIVSMLVRTRLPERKDLLSPAEVVVDENKRVVGCRSFDVN